MYRSTRIYLIVLPLLFPSGPWASDAKCYFPNGSIAPKNYQACHPEKLDGSACCDMSKSSVCLTGGYCIGNDRFIYRGACSDSTWASPSCAKECKDTAPDTYSNIFPCESGVYTKNFCCSDESKTTCCDNAYKQLKNFNPGSPYAPSSGLQDHTSTSILSASSSTSNLSSTSTSPSTRIFLSTTISTNQAVSGTSAPSPIPSSRNFTAIGLGFGVPLSLLLLLSLGFFLYRERQLRTMMESLKREKQGAMSQMPRRQPHGQYPLVPNNEDPPELEHTYRAPVELHSQSRQVHGAATRVELETRSLETRSYHS